jgi:hypothetical protein
VPSTFKLVHVVLLKRHKFYPLGKKKKKAAKSEMPVEATQFDNVIKNGIK